MATKKKDKKRKPPSGGGKGRGKKQQLTNRPAPEAPVMNTTDPNDRKYPDIDAREEYALRAVVRGYSYREIGKSIGLSHSVVCVLLKKPAVLKALEIEKAMVFAEMREKYPDMVFKAHETIRQALVGLIDPEVGRFALSFLDKGGYLILSDDKVAADAKRMQMAADVASELALLSEMAHQQAQQKHLTGETT